MEQTVNNWSPNMDIEEFKQEILKFIRENNGSCNLNSVIVYLFPLLKQMNESSNLVVFTITNMISEDLIKINNIGMFEVTEQNNIKSEPERSKHASEIYEEHKEQMSRNTEKQNSLNLTQSKVNDYVITDENTQVLKKIKEHFKHYLGVDLTFEQTLDRAFMILKNQISLNPMSIVSTTFLDPKDSRPLPFRSMGESESRFTSPFKPSMFNEWVRPPSWNEAVVKCGNSFNPPSHFNQMPYPGTPRRAEFVSARELISQDNVKAMRAGLDEAGLSNRGLDFNTMHREGPSSFLASTQHVEGPYTHVYPDFRNMVLPQREELPMTSKKPVTKRKPKK